MTSLKHAFVRHRAALLTLAFLSAAACPKPGDQPSGGSSSAGPAAGNASNHTVTVRPADTDNKRSASVKFETTAPMKDGQLAFELPAECRITAGAAVRPIKGLAPDHPVSQELAFECPPAASGSLKAKYTGTDDKGQSFDKTAEGNL